MHCFAFIDDAIADADSELQNAFQVSYAQSLAWGTAHEQTARRLVSDRLAMAFDRMLEWPLPTDSAA